MIYNFLNNQYLIIIFSVFILLIGSVVIRFTLKIIGSHWISNKANYYTIFLLPQIAFIITKVISGNIALSLGMIGALSIVRFRHPVKSPFELSIYFALITLGISMSVSMKWGLLLLFLVCVIVMGIYYFEKNTKEESNFGISDSDIFLEIHSKKKIPNLDDSKYLKNYIEDREDDKFTYRLIFEDNLTMDSTLKKIEENKGVIKIFKTFN